MNTHTLTFTHIRPPDGDKRNVKFKVSVIGIPIKYSLVAVFLRHWGDSRRNVLINTIMVH